MRKLSANPGQCMVVLGAVVALGSACQGEPTAPADAGPADPSLTGVRITVTSSGLDFPSEYTVTVDGSPEQQVVGTTTITGLGSGSHTVTLIVPANCSVAGENPRVVTVAEANIVPVDFAVSCVATTGAIEVSIAAVGVDIPAFSVLLGSPEQEEIGRFEFSTGVATVSDLAPGEYLVTLDDTSSNCTVTDPGPRTLTVTAGNATRDTVRTAFDASCVKTEKIAFTRDPNSYTPGIFVAHLDGSSVVQLGMGRMGSWSPDGSRIVFTFYQCGYWWDDHLCLESGLATMTADGQNVTRLTNESANSYASWGPDGTRIAFVSGARLYVMSSDGSTPVAIVEPGTPAGLRGASHPAWSPDGSRLAFTCEWGVAAWTDICIVNADGTGLVRVMSDAWDDANPAWSPDGTWIAFATNRGTVTGEYQIAIMQPDGSEITWLAAGVDPAWSPDGTRLVFASERPAGLHTINLDGTGLARLTDGNDRAPAWRP